MNKSRPCFYQISITADAWHLTNSLSCKSIIPLRISDPFKLLWFRCCIRLSRTLILSLINILLFFYFTDDCKPAFTAENSYLFYSRVWLGFLFYAFPFYWNHKVKGRDEIIVLWLFSLVVWIISLWDSF